MSGVLNDDKWLRRGVSVLWDSHVLGDLDAAGSVVSLRAFLMLFNAGWPDEEHLPLVGGDALFVAGLDVSIDSMEPIEAEEWLQEHVFEAIYDFQNEMGTGLVFWMPDQDRWRENIAENSFDWVLGSKFRGELFPLGQCIWNGAQQDLMRIEKRDGNRTRSIGLYVDRIS